MFVLLLIIINSKEISSTFVINPPIIDGELADSCWYYASKDSNFLQFYPNPKEPAPNKTIVYLCHTRDALYIGFECHTPHRKVFAKETIRDREASLGGDETIGLDIDANWNKKDAFMIAVTPLNTQTDGTITRDGEEMGLEWDGGWVSQVSYPTPYGWSAEIEVPFNVIEAKGNKFGVNFSRLTHGEDGTPHVYLWVFNEIPWKVSTFGMIYLPEGEVSYRTITPSNTLFLSPEYGAFWGSKNTKIQQKIGVNVKYIGIQGLNLVGVCNPDYAQIESDVDEINLTKTRIYLPERRPFFQNELSFFHTPINLFYTRNLEEIKYGTNVKYRKTDFTSNAYWVNSDNTNYFILRATQNVLRSSEISLMGIYVDKLQPEKVGNIDANFVLPYNLSITTQLCGTSQDTNLSHAYHVSVKRIPVWGWKFILSREYIKPYFNPSTSFILFDDFVSHHVELGYMYPTRNQLIPAMFLNSSYNHWENTNGEFLRDEYSGIIGAQLKGNLQIGTGYTQEHRLWRDNYYSNKTVQVYASYQKENTILNVSYTGGEYYGTMLTFLQGGINIGMFRKVTLSASTICQSLKHMDNVESTKYTWALKCNYRMLPKLSLRTFIQWSEIGDKFETNFLISYEFFTGSHIYFVWNDVRDIEFNSTRELPPLQDRRAFFKVCYQFKF